MDITPQVINEVEFRQKVRGYDPDEVDDFLERMAVAVGQLQERLREAAERAATAEERIAALGGGDVAPKAAARVQADGTADTISRAILTAQRTADALVQEARDAAERTVSESREQAKRLLADTQAQAKRQIEEAEEEARRAHQGTSARLLAEIREFEAARNDLSGDVDLLDAHLEEQRLRVRTSIDELQRLLDSPESLRVAPVPGLSGRAAPEAIDDEADEADTLDQSSAPAGRADAHDGPEALDETDDRDDLDLSFTVGGRAGDRWDVADPPQEKAAAKSASKAAANAPVKGSAKAPMTSGPVDVERGERAALDEERAWARFTGADDEEGGPPTAAHRIDLDAPEDDAYLAELRMAMAGEDEVGSGGPLFDQDDPQALSADRRPRPRFGRKR